MIALNDRQTGESRMNGSQTPPQAGPIFSAEEIEMNRRIRFNPLRQHTPENYASALDQFDHGLLRQAALVWDAMCRRDDTLKFVKGMLENSIAAKPWGVHKRKNADPIESARHAAALEYFWANVTATDAFDRNIQGTRHLLLKQMGQAASYTYAVHHFVWKPTTKLIPVEGAAPVPAITAELEFVPLWFFENLTGKLRLLPNMGLGYYGEELNWDGEWTCTTGAGLMFAAGSCYTFKKLTFQDWVIFNERYSQGKVVVQTAAQKGTTAGEAAAAVARDFRGDMALVFYESNPSEKPPVHLMGPEGTVSVDLFERFLDRQDRKMTVMYRGSDLRNMSREKETTGVSAQTDETEAMEIAHCAHIADSCRQIDRQVLKFCFGPNVDALAYFGLPDMDKEDAKDLRESAGFLADRGALVELETIAERLGVTLTEDEADALKSLAPDPADPNAGDDPVLKREIAYDQYKSGKKAANRLMTLVEEALVATNVRSAQDDDIERWITVHGRHIPIHKGESEQQAIEKHTHWEQGATKGEKNRRFNAGQKWHSGQRKSEKKSKETSQTSDKKPNLSKENERSSRAESGAEKTGGSVPTDGERTTRAVLGRAAGTDAAGDRGAAAGSADDYLARLDRNRAEREALDQAAREHPELVIDRRPDREIGRGAEHHVEHSAADPTRVLKHTHSGFGFTLEAHQAPFGGYVSLRDATPSEYVHRMDAMNHAFGDDTRIEGVTRNGGLVVSQRAIQGSEPSQGEVESFMKAGGYQKVAADAIDGDHITGKTWFHPGTGIVATDVKPDNFKKDPQGRIKPVDLIVLHAPAGSSMHRILSTGGKQA